MTPDDPYESVIFQADTGAMERLSRSLFFPVPELPMLEDAPPEAFGMFFDAITRPAPGYREIANADGIRWHERIADDA